jgi:hypothetical protein
MDLIINKILFNTINIILFKFNKSINANIILYIDNKDEDWRKWISYKDYLEITYNKLSKTNNKNIYKIEKQITLFKYYFKRKTIWKKVNLKL